MHFVALLSPLSVMQNLEIGQASRTWQLQSSGDCQHLKFSGWSILCFHWDSAVLSELISNTGMSLSFPIVFTSLQLCPEIFGTNPGGAGYSADLQQSSCCHDSSTLILVTSLERFLNLSFARCFVGSGFRWWNWIWRSLTAKFQNGRFWFFFYSFCTAKALALGHIWLKIRMVWHKVSTPTLLPNCAATLKSSMAQRCTHIMSRFIIWSYKETRLQYITVSQFHSELNFRVHLTFDWFWNWTGLLGFGQNTCHQAVWSHHLSTRNCCQFWVDPLNLGISWHFLRHQGKTFLHSRRGLFPRPHVPGSLEPKWKTSQVKCEHWSLAPFPALFFQEAP